jgi:hypothetical protein
LQPGASLNFFCLGARLPDEWHAFPVRADHHLVICRSAARRN